ncbi:MAG TPA: CDP-diacylglycerol--serine O-phosphatidyltransferase [Stellaceae bacterium]|jgi:CDP-diacylglycerol---serine O-phosphatidyltransferase|nr:CDP-diacylglycerol--serine O-phosphatidyltransferase [Stellaceae bacterium]
MKRPRLRRHLQVKPIRGFSFNRMIPNILTLLALCAGMTAIRFALEEHYRQAVVAIIVAGIFDGIDGRIARLLKGTSEFGAELDSLSDFVSFGVAPALLMYLWSVQSLSSLGWMVALLFAICCGLRLARFNTQIGADLPPYAYNFFTGVPAPAGAGLAMIPMFLSFEFGWSGFRSGWFGAVVLAAVGALMVSRVPTFSLKRFHLPREWVLAMFLIIGGLAALATTEPWATLLLIGLIYVGSFPLSIRAYNRLRRAAQEMRAANRGELVELEHPHSG